MAHYEVIAGTVGTVYSGSSATEAKRVYDRYAQKARAESGRDPARRRHGPVRIRRSRRDPARAPRQTKTVAEASARRLSEGGQTWIVVYRPRTKSFDEYSVSSVNAAPFGERTQLTSIWHEGRPQESLGMYRRDDHGWSPLASLDGGRARRLRKGEDIGAAFAYYGAENRGKRLALSVAPPSRDLRTRRSRRDPQTLYAVIGRGAEADWGTVLEQHRRTGEVTVRWHVGKITTTDDRDKLTVYKSREAAMKDYYGRSQARRDRRDPSKARKYYVVDQAQGGLWEQVGRFYSREDAARFQASVPGRSRIVHTYPSGRNAPVMRDKRRSRRRDPAHLFPIGAKVYIDGRDLARVKGVFPQGSSSFAFPHYKVDFIGGDKNVAVRLDRVGVVKKGVR